MEIFFLVTFINFVVTFRKFLDTFSNLTVMSLTSSNFLVTIVIFWLFLVTLDEVVETSGYFLVTLDELLGLTVLLHFV